MNILKSLEAITTEIDNDLTDLLVIKNDKTSKFIAENIPAELITEFDYKGDTWYSIEDGYKAQWEHERTPYNSITMEPIEQPSLPKELSDSDYSFVNKQLFKIFKSDNFAYTSTSSYAAFWNNENPANTNARFIKHENHLLRSVTMIGDDLIAIYEDENEVDYFYKIVCK